MHEAKKFTKEQIESFMPQQPPYLFLDEAQIEGNEVRGSYTIRGDEFFLKGHFPNNPVFPASVMLEALGQLAIVILMKGDFDPQGRNANRERIFFTSLDGVRCCRICRPGDKLEMLVKAKRIRHPLGLFEGSISVGGQKTAYAEKISLTFDF
ncbi:MAG: 3-hydroxyacyl-ACP dehydratase [Opitutales bacterium]|nr:3-hydroxyacyl-ACP dehydratase [Opitutales bacterium]